MPTAREVFGHGPRPSDEQRELEDRFFRELRMPNGTYKTTTPGRLAAFDDLILRYLQSGSEVTLLDIGVASGVTTLDLENRLNEVGCEHRIVAADRYLYAQLVRLGPGIEVLLSKAGDLLQLSVGNWTRPRPQSSAAWKNAVMKFGLDCVAFLANRWGTGTEEIALVTSGLQNHRVIDLAEQDVQQFHPEWEGQFDAIRGANVLNLAYFRAHELEAVIGHLARYLKDGGLLAVCRTDDDTGTHHGSIFVKDSKGAMTCVDQLGSGSEISAIVLAVRLS